MHNCAKRHWNNQDKNTYIRGSISTILLIVSMSPDTIVHDIIDIQFEMFYVIPKTWVILRILQKVSKHPAEFKIFQNWRWKHFGPIELEEVLLIPRIRKIHPHLLKNCSFSSVNFERVALLGVRNRSKYLWLFHLLSQKKTCFLIEMRRFNLGSLIALWLSCSLRTWEV